MYLDTSIEGVDGNNSGNTRSSGSSKHLFVSLPSELDEDDNFEDELPIKAPSANKSNQKTSLKVRNQIKKALISLRCIILPLTLQRILVFLPIIGYIAIFANYQYFRVLFGLDADASRAANKTILPAAEMAMLGFMPHRILGKHNHIVLDFLAAAPYLFHFILPFVFLIYVFLSENRNKSANVIFKYVWLQGLLCFIGSLTQLFFPTAPPWFNDSAIYKNGVLLSYGSSEAAFSRIDAVINFPLFHSIYSQSKVQFGAFPSLHCAWPALILFYYPFFSYKVSLLHVTWIVWAAMYTGHHYFVDALGGIFLSGLIVFIHSDFFNLKKILYSILKFVCVFCTPKQLWQKFAPTDLESVV